ncbi:MAG: ABC transporter substrate-binding protein [Oscillospiraceae bacterium]
MKKITKTIAAALAAVSVMMTGAGCSSGESSGSAAGENNGKVQLTLGVIKALGTATPYVAQKNGYFDEAGIDVKIVDFSDGSSLMEAFVASDIDIAMCGVAPVANWFSKGVDVQVVASANGGGHVILTRADTGITSLNDLKGHSLAEPNLGTVTDTLLRSYILKNAGIDPENDLTIVPGMKPADMAISLFDTGEVDAILTWEPYVTQALATYDDAVILYDSPLVLKDELGTDSFYAVNVVSASKEVIDNRKDDLKKFLEVYTKTVDYINTDAGANAVIASVLEMDESVVAGARQRIDYTAKIDKDALERTLQWGLELGYFDSIPARDEFFADLD